MTASSIAGRDGGGNRCREDCNDLTANGGGILFGISVSPGRFFYVAMKMRGGVRAVKRNHILILTVRRFHARVIPTSRHDRIAIQQNCGIISALSHRRAEFPAPAHVHSVIRCVGDCMFDHIALPRRQVTRAATSGTHGATPGATQSGGVARPAAHAGRARRKKNDMPQSSRIER